MQESEDNVISRTVVHAAVTVHQALGPGLLERVYEAALADELTRKGLSVERQVPVPVVYRDLYFDEGFRLDMRIASCVVVELKCVEAVSKAHKKQLLTYLRLSGLELGLLLNFGEALMRDGIFRVANGVPENE